MILRSALLWSLCRTVVLALMVCAPLGAHAQARFHAALDPVQFPVPSSLRPNVAFWRDIFTRYESSQTVIHDDLYLDVVFSVVDVSDLEEKGRSAVAIDVARRKRVRAEVEKYQRVLGRLAGDARADASPADVERVRALYARSGRSSTDFRAAVDRVRGQGGLRDHFEEAIRTSGMFMPGIERILRDHGVPDAVKCLPFVESMFNYRARSSVGASGVWQFTASTGRLYLQMDPAVDARSDPWLAAAGAAKMLADHYEQVQSWPLALTGYNHGIAGMVRAVRQVGTNDIGAIIERYRSPSFGFASRNFYAEFVAAVTVYADRSGVFPGVQPLPPLQFDEFVPERFVSLLDLAHLTATDVDDMVELNPALHPAVAKGELLIPSTYPLRVPPGTLSRFEKAFERLPDERKPERQLTVTYRVKRGDTLSHIARSFGTSTAALQRANGLRRADRIFVGQRLEIRSSGTRWSPLVWTGEPESLEPRTLADEVRVHIVRAGETLTQIARRYGLSIGAIIAANDLVAPNVLKVGTRLTIPTP